MPSAPAFRHTGILSNRVEPEFFLSSTTIWSSFNTMLNVRLLRLYASVRSASANTLSQISHQLRFCLTHRTQTMRKTTTWVVEGTYAGKIGFEKLRSVDSKPKETDQTTFGLTLAALISGVAPSCQRRSTECSMFK